MHKNKQIAPYIHFHGGLKSVMWDVVIALIPLIIISWFAHGWWSIAIIGIATVTALISEIILGQLFLGKGKSIVDGSSIITAILLSFTLSAFTDWGVVAFGAFSAVLFGKILSGGIGKNRFNPALLGREFMTAFFPLIMLSSSLWSSQNYIETKEIPLFNFLGQNEFTAFANQLFFQPTGAIGEHSPLLIILGGLFLLLRKRISWHIPLFLLLSFFVFTQFWAENPIKYSLGGVLLGAIFMATDMPSSPSSPTGKSYYGAMIGLSAFIFLYNKINFEYMSYSILILNAFSTSINEVFAPRAWGTKRVWFDWLEQIFFLTIKILAVVFAVTNLHFYGSISVLLFIYIIYLLLKFNYKTIKELKIKI